MQILGTCDTMGASSWSCKYCMLLYALMSYGAITSDSRLINSGGRLHREFCSSLIRPILYVLQLFSFAPHVIALAAISVYALCSLFIRRAHSFRKAIIPSVQIVIDLEPHIASSGNGRNAAKSVVHQRCIALQWGLRYRRHQRSRQHLS